MIVAGSAKLSALFVAGASLPSTGYLGQLELKVRKPLEDGATLIVKNFSMTSGSDVDVLDVSNAVVTFTATATGPGDFDGDRNVGLADFLAFAAVFGTSQGNVRFDARMDFNGDGNIDFVDFLAFGAVFGSVYTSADLVVESVSVSNSSLAPGQSFTLKATVRNQGAGDADATTLRYYRSNDPTISISDVQVDTFDVGSLAASGTSASSVNLTAPSNAGTYYYGACVESVSGESNTKNNCSTGARMTVSGSADLVVESISVSSNDLTLGQSFTVRATVRNKGAGQADATTLRYYRSNDPTISISDVQVDTFDVGSLAASGTSASSVNLTAPSIAGTYYYGACVGTVSGEINTKNNCSTGAQVTVARSSTRLVGPISNLTKRRGNDVRPSWSG